MSDRMTDTEIAERPLTWICRFHPTDWFHEIGCPHVEWTKEQLQSAIESTKRSQPKLYAEWQEKNLRLIDELKAARADAQLLTEKFDNLQELYYHSRAQRDAARAQAFEEAAQICWPLNKPHQTVDEILEDAGSRGVPEDGASWIVADETRQQLVAEIRRRANAPDGSRTATPEEK